MSTDHRDRIGAWAMRQFAQEAFDRVIHALSAANLEAVAVKGIVLGRELYGAGVERFMGDVDLRVRPADLRKVSRLAHNEGWRVTRNSRQLGTLELDLGIGGPLVEVESTVGPPGVCAIDVATIMRRGIRRQTADGRRWIEPELHDHALLLCVNVFKDKLVLAHPWAREDLVRIVGHTGFSAATLAARAEEAKLRELVAVVAKWLGTARWLEVASLLERGHRRRLYARTYLALGTIAPESRLLAVITRAASDDPTMRAKALLLGVCGTVGHAWRMGDEWWRSVAQRT